MDPRALIPACARLPAGGVRVARWVALAVLTIALAPLTALACAVCAPTAPLTVVQRMIDADRAVLAVPDSGPLPAWRIVEVLKGDPGGSAPDASAPIPRDAGERPVLWVRDALSREWTPLAAVAASRTEWLRSLGRFKRTAEMDASDWTTRVAAFVPLLEDPEPLVAETAYGEVARAPYAAMRANRTSLDAMRLARWVDDPNLADRRPLYLLLLGLAGGPADAARIERRLAARRPGTDTTDLPALIAAQLELRGAARLPAVEKAWLLDPARTQQEVRAAIVAMSVHGGSPGPVSREAVVGAYLRFVERRRPLAGLVAQDLAGWKVWDATPRYAAWVDAPDVPMWSRIAMLQYLRESPDPAAKPAIERALRAR